MNDYPKIIPIFPLTGVIFFPKTNLPLNIFEKRYLDLVNDAYDKNKMMGMVQSKNTNNSIYNIGCLGRISDYQKSKDGRILINLTGITRFKILDEKRNDKLYREFEVDYKYFEQDIIKNESETSAFDLIDKAKKFLEKNGLLLNWKEFDKLELNEQVNTLAMISPITNEEKQKLLETVTFKEKILILENIINFYLHEVNFNNRTIQ
tara:strand:- start:489 stop:1106 length:618 start_codon:yes stop_codon:yes gene_type:complete